MTPQEQKMNLAKAKYLEKEKRYNRKVFDSEAKFQNYVLKRLKPYKGKHLTVFKTIKSNEMGVADLILCIKGRFVAIELKHKGNTATEHQRKFLESVRNTSGIGALAWSWGDIKAIFIQAGLDIEGLDLAEIEKAFQ